jgi:hypothetical protein
MHTHTNTLTYTTCRSNEIFHILLCGKSFSRKEMGLHFELNLCDVGSILADITVNWCGMIQCRTRIPDLETAQQILDYTYGQTHSLLYTLTSYAFLKYRIRMFAVYTPMFWIWWATRRLFCSSLSPRWSAVFMLRRDVNLQRWFWADELEEELCGDRPSVV